MNGLELHNVSHRYGQLLAVDGVSLTVRPGEVVCLLGPSGCGKTTLLRIAAGLEPLQAGQVRIGGALVADEHQALPPERRDIGMVFQDYALFPHLTVLENVAFGLHQLPRRERLARAREVLASVGMVELEGAYPHTLSGGQQQRVALARAVAPRPAVMLLDEPFAGLDRRLREQVREESLRVLQASGAAVLLVTHDPEEAMAMGDRIAIMRAGRLEQTGPAADVYLRPASAFVAHFLGPTNRWLGVVRDGIVATPIGPIPVNPALEGRTVEVLLRPEFLRLEPAAAEEKRGAPRAVVRDTRLLGALTSVHLSLNEPDGREHALLAWQPGVSSLRRGDIVQLKCDSSQAFIFPHGVEQVNSRRVAQSIDPAAHQANR